MSRVESGLTCGPEVVGERFVLQDEEALEPVPVALGALRRQAARGITLPALQAVNKQVRLSGQYTATKGR